MIQTYPCPGASRWQALLADADSADSAELEAHLASCSRCRTVLDELAVGESGWLRDASRLAASTDPDPEMTKTLHRLRDYFPDDAQGPPIPLDFLSPSDQPGLLGTLGRYQVLEVIGRGAMGIVLKAIDPDLLRPVAVKVLAPWLASSGTARQRFLREARAAAAVSHDHIVTIHAVEPGDLPFIVMEFISGISLQARLDRDGPLPPRDIARIGHQAACGLAAAHAVGLVHRDVKPANILLENGVERVKITDFGLARAADDARLTQSGTAAGTPLYMSPEQARGEAVDPRSDLFSLGAVLYTLATGFPPFRAGSTMGVLNRIANDPPRPIRETVPDFPAALEGIIMQLLEKDPSKRFQVAADVSVKLTGFLADPQAEPRQRRRRTPKALAGLLPILAGIFVLGTVLIFNTPKGTLIVEVDDPSIRVAVDGEELSISGAGVGQVSLRPGTYHVTGNRLGRPATVDPPVVTITKDGKQVVKVTVKPPDAPRGPEAEPNSGLLLQQRILTMFPDINADARGLMLTAWIRATPEAVSHIPAPQPGGYEGHKSYQKLQSLLVEASRRDIDSERLRQVLTEARNLADTIHADWRAAREPAPKKDPPKIDPAWDTVLRPLSDQFTALRGRLAGTKGNRFVTLPGPVTDLDKATADLADPDRATVKRLLALRDQFALAYPKAHQLATRIGLLRDQPQTGHQIEILENDLRVQHAALANALIEMEKLARSLGANASTADPNQPSTADPDGRAKSLRTEFTGLIAELKRTRPGEVLTTGPGKARDRVLMFLLEQDGKRAERLLSVRDQFDQLGQQLDKEIGKWEQARLAAREARERFAAGMISANDLEKAELVLKDAQRALGTTENAMERIVAELRTFAKDLTPVRPEDPTEAEYKKIMAEFDALTLRLVNTPTGRVLALSEGEAVSEMEMTSGGVPQAGRENATRLLAIRTRIKAQKIEADNQLAIIHRAGSQGDPAALQSLMFRNGALRGLVDDFKKLADEIDPPPGPDVELNKVMAEFEAVVLRLADTSVGRVLALYPPDRGWSGEGVRKVFPGDATKGDQAVWLLETRARIETQKELADKALKERATQIHRKAQTEKDPAARALADEAIRKAENETRLRVVALRGLVGELKLFADRNGGSKGK